MRRLVLLLILSISNQVVLIHCNLVSNNYQHETRAFFTFATNKSFGQF